MVIGSCSFSELGATVVVSLSRASRSFFPGLPHPRIQPGLNPS